MDILKIFLSTYILVLLASPNTNAQTVRPPTPTPAPAPAPDYVNLTDLLSVAGPFKTFLSYLQSTQVIQTFQNQANNTQQGITIFVPKDQSFSSLRKPSLANLTAIQLKSLLLFHALPQYYSLAEFTNLSKSSPVNTLAGGLYTLNFTDVSGTVHVSSGWSNTKITSSVHSTDPVALYQVDKVLLPQAIFGTPPPPSPAPAPSPNIAPISGAGTPGVRVRGSSPKSSSSTSASIRISFGPIGYLAFVSFGCLMMVL